MYKSFLSVKYLMRVMSR